MEMFKNQCGHFGPEILNQLYLKNESMDLPDVLFFDSDKKNFG